MIPIQQNLLSKELSEYLEKERYQLVINLSIVIFTAFGILSISFLSEDLISWLTMIVGVVISCFGLFYTYFTKNYKLTLYIYSISGVFVSGFALLNLHTATHYGELLWMTASVMLGFFGIGKKFGLFLLTSTILLIIIFIWFELNTNIISISERTDFQKFAVTAELTIGLCCITYILNLFVNFHNLSRTQLTLANENLEHQNATIKAQDIEKTILVKEIHHRVKNNLQIISSLLRLQSNEINNEEAKLHFEEATNRIIVMSMIHQRLYDGKELSKIQLQHYIQEMAEDLLRIFDTGKDIRFEITSSIESIGLKSIVPFGLIINELISNSLKYAFEAKNDGKICISISKTKTNEILLEFEDSGIWKTSKSDKKGFGLELIDLLTEQLDGTLKLQKTNDATKYLIQFKQLND